MTRTILSLVDRLDRERMAETLDTISFLQSAKARRRRIANVCAGAIAILWGEVFKMQREADRGR